MKNNETRKIKEFLEELYDIPFDVDCHSLHNDLWYEIQPYNLNQELFSINVRLKNQLRLVLEVNPQKYAAFSIQDMGIASQEKKRIFAEYGAQLEAMRAKIDFSVNGVSCLVSSPETWPDSWNKYSLRVTRSPICSEDEIYDETTIVTTWAAIIVGMFLSLLNIEMINNPNPLEGGLKRVETNRYERNPVNRQLCLIANGYSCKICGFNFEYTYGRLGHNFIHVHHIIPVSKIDTAYEIDPIQDLIPVCPNCHAMLHRNDPPLTPDELEGLLLAEINKK